MSSTVVNDSKLFQLVSEFEKFRIEVDEDIDSIYTRFTKIVNESKVLGKNFSNGDLVRKILRSLPSKFNLNVTAISESHDLNTLQIESLVENLKTHEVELKIQQREYTFEPKKKLLVLKSKKEEESETDEDDKESLCVKKFKRFMRNPEKRNSFKNYFKKESGFRKGVMLKMMRNVHHRNVIIVERLDIYEASARKYLKEQKEKRHKKKDKKKGT
ncbi:hypothetical protein KSP39_PZI004938 [Platanthera zijinensis]|uniref:UBN2 domain-containing protein n=1 Tax=Platanthera zijinensis TaxID=2320716 RepID=A0AAP0BTY4_9ASPA